MVGGDDAIYSQVCSTGFGGCPTGDLLPWAAALWSGGHNGVLVLATTMALLIYWIRRKTILDRDVSPWRRIRRSTLGHPFGSRRVQRITGGDGFDHSFKGREGSDVKRSQWRGCTESHYFSFL